MLQGYLCQQSLSSHGYTLEFPAYRMLSFELCGFKSRINRHVLTVGSFETSFWCFFSCDSMPRSGCSALHGVNAIFFLKLIEKTLVWHLSTLY